MATVPPRVRPIKVLKAILPLVPMARSQVLLWHPPILMNVSRYGISLEIFMPLQFERLGIV